LWNSSQWKTLPLCTTSSCCYLRLADKRLGMLINFGQELLKDSIHRVVNGLSE
jgi:hypothetical protein